jgi:hypothetical protein
MKEEISIRVIRAIRGEQMFVGVDYLRKVV